METNNHNISEIIYYWASCAKDIWTRWFENQSDGEHKFINVEKELFYSLVLDNINIDLSKTENIYEVITCKRKETTKPDDKFLIMHRQASGNYYGSEKEYLINSNIEYKIHGFDFSNSYTEKNDLIINVNENELLIDSINQYDFFLNKK